MNLKKIVFFASGSGSNVENIVRYFKGNPSIEIVAVLTNKADAKVLKRCERLGISALFFNRMSFSGSDCILSLLKALQPDLIVLAGFLWRMPENIINAFDQKIINIHPALLPKYGGKGMYGDRVHTAVKANKESETGITIHYVNANYDEGAVIYQAKTLIKANDSAADIAKKYKH